MARRTSARRNGSGRRAKGDRQEEVEGKGAWATKTLRDTYTGVDVNASDMQLVVRQKQSVFPLRHFFLCLPRREGHLHSTHLSLKVELLLLILLLLLLQGVFRGP
jgi:hypothetical protein